MTPAPCIAFLSSSLATNACASFTEGEFMRHGDVVRVICGLVGRPLLLLPSLFEWGQRCHRLCASRIVQNRAESISHSRSFRIAAMK